VQAITVRQSLSGPLHLAVRIAVLLTVFLSLWTGLAPAQTPCALPDQMKAQFADKPNAAAYNDLGVWFAGHKQYACAADAFATSLQMDPAQKDLPHIAFMFGVALDFSGDQKEAIAALQQAEQLGYRALNLHVILATALDSTHETKEAETEWREALKFDPELSTALDALSNDLLADGDFKGMIAALEQPRLLGQRTPQQSLNLAAAYTGVGSEEKAATVLRDGLNTSPDSLTLANKLADSLVQLKRLDEARSVLQLALEQHPGDAETATHLAKVRAVLGNGK
jgi:Flp pilus assembly protein TadD